MSKPIWAHPAPGSRRPKLTREQIATCAVAIADAEGFDAVAMRRIAEELGVGTMTLYYYVRTKDDLIALMDDALMGEVLIPPGKLPAHWRDAVAMIALYFRRAFLRHPWALANLQGTRVGPNQLKHAEQSMAAVRTAPFDVAGKLALVSAVDDYVFGHLLRLHDPWPAGDAQTVQAMRELLRAQLASGDYPELATIVGDRDPIAVFAEVASVMTDDQRFERGLQAMLDGFEHPRARTRSRPRKRARPVR